MCCLQTHHGNRGFDLSWVRFNTVFLFFMCLIFAAGVGFLFFFHIYIVLTNKTTLGNHGCILEYVNSIVVYREWEDAGFCVQTRLW